MADQFDPSTATPVDDFDPSTAQPYTPAGPLRRLADTGLALAKGVIGLPESYVGMADLATKGKIGKLAEQAGIRFKDAKNILTSFQSEDQQAADREVQQADGLLPMAGAMVQNPSTIVNAVAESAPSMIGGGAVARGVMKAASKVGAITAGAIGEGAVAAGQNAEQVRQETKDGLLTGNQSAILAGSGLATGAISRLSGGLANKLGIGDLQTMIAAGKLGTVGEKAAAEAAKKGPLRKVAEGALVEGGLQELPQSAQEQAAQNIALGKPWDEGVGAAAAQGLLVGGVTGAVGGGMGALSGEPGAPPPAPAVAPPAAAPQGVTAPSGVQPVAGGVQGVAAPERVGALQPDLSITDATIKSESPLPTIDPAAGPLSRAAALLAGPGGVISAPMLPAPTSSDGKKGSQAPSAQPASGGKPPGSSSAQQPVAQPSNASQPPVAGNPTPVQRETPRPQGPIATAAAKAAAPAPVPAPASPAPANQPAADVAAVPPVGAQPGPAALTPTPTTPQEPTSEKAPEAVQGQARREEPSQAAPSVDASGAAVQPAASPAVGPEVQGNAPPAGQKVVQSVDPDTGEITFEQSAPAVDDVNAAANFAATSLLNDTPEPTEAQAKAGNYRKGHFKWKGLDIAFENPKGSERKGVDPNGKPWSVKMPAHYGYIKRTTGADGDQVDIYMGDTPESDRVFVVDQQDADTKKWDEHKVILGARSLFEATRLYDQGFSDGRGKHRRRAITPMSIDEFKAWVYDGPKNKPLDDSRYQAMDKEPAAAPAAGSGSDWFLGKFGKGMKQANAEMKAANLNKTKTGPAITYVAEKHGMPDMQEEWGVIGRKSSNEVKKPEAPAPVASRFTGEPDSKNTPPVDKLGDFKGGDTVDVPNKTIGRSTVEVLFKRTMAGFGQVDMARIQGPDGKRVDVLLSELVKVTPAAKKPVTPQVPPPLPQSSYGEKGPYARWQDSNPAQRRELLREAGYTDADQARVLSGTDWNQLTDPVRRALSAAQPAVQKVTVDKAEIRPYRKSDGSIGYEAVPIVDTPKAKPVANANTIFTEDAAAAARARLKAKLGRLSSGIDPETMLDGITLAGYHIEKGARTFAAYAKAMIEDLGDAVKPYLKSWYMGVRYDPRASTFEGMSSAAEVEAASLDALETPPQKADTAPKAPHDPAPPTSPPAVDKPLDAGQPPGPVQGTEPIRGAEQPRAGDGRSDGPSVRDQRGRQEGPDDAGQDLGDRAGNAGVPDKPADPVGAGGGGVSSRDFRPAVGGLTRTGSWHETAKRNLDLIDLAIKIEAEKRPATPAEQEQLSKYVGFGAGAIRNEIFPIPSQWDRQQNPGRLIFPDLVRNDRWKPLAERAAALPIEWQRTILQSTQYAHYTSEGIIRSIWSAVQRLGFTGGKIMEPGAGIGSFAMLMPEQVHKTSKYTGIEFDGPTALIGRLLSPEQHVLHTDFIKRNLPDNFYDVAVGNPPFSQTPILADPRYEKFGFMLHDYFFAKAMDKVRPGGLLAFVTSKGTMDKKTDKARKFLADRADLVGAIRLPSTAFEDNAGTSVVTDVIFLRKRAPGEAPAGKAWTNVKTVETKDGPVVINEYYADNPSMVLGQHRISGNVDDEGRRINSNGYGGERYTLVSYDKTPAELDAKFAAAIEQLPANVYSAASQGPTSVVRETAKMDFDPKIKREGVLYLGKNGELLRVEEGTGKALSEVVKLSEKDKAWLTSYVGLRDLIQEARQAQVTDADWQGALKKLNKAYDAFVAKHGPVNAFRAQVRTATDEEGNQVESTTRVFTNRRLYREDYDSAIVTQIETIDEDGNIKKAPFLLGRTVGKPVTREVKSIGDALAVSLDEIGRLDIGDVAARMKIKPDEAIEALGKQVYKTPTGQWQLADEYLSGDVVTKLEEAMEASRLDRTLERNVEALREVQPEKLGPSQISVKLGAPWVGAKHVSEFAKEIEAGTVTFDPKTETWQVEGGNMRSERKAGAEFGTAKRSPSEILEAVLNSRSIKVMKTVANDSGKGTKDVVDTEATTAANEVAKKMKEKFRTWVWTDSERAADLVEAYNLRYNNIAPRRFDGSHLTLPGVSLRYKLHPHQLRAIWRQIQTGNVYLAHAVGAGKTIEMIAGGMEQKRLGLIKKPIYVVPNHMLEQFANEFMELYPLANIMVADDQNFSKERRKAFIAAATLNAPDAIVITHSAFERIGVKPESVQPIIDEIISDLQDELESVGKDSGNRVRRGQLEQQIEAVNQRFDSILAAGKKDGTVTFEEMGADYVYVDEAHTYRKLDFHTAQTIKGIDPNGSRRALDMYVKTRWLEKQRPGRSMTFASGTAVTNTMGEIYTIMRFFAPEILERGGIATFDSWARMFGEVKSAMEPNAAGKYEIVERFSRFDNVPELMARVRQFMDVLQSDQLGAIVKRPDTEGGKPQMILVEPTKAMLDYQKNVLLPRLEESRKWKPTFDEPNNPDPVIAIITDGRFAATDPRFIPGGKVLKGEMTKIDKAADEILAEYKATAKNQYVDRDGKPMVIKGGTQIVFYNVGFGANAAVSRGFNSRAVFTKRLTDGGIRREQIAWFDDADTDAKKEAVFKGMRNGTYRVLIGSAKKMGTGVNVQNRLTALHYMDPPWFPADVEQPRGRIIRQGNQNAVVREKWYATKGGYDSTMWQMVGRKQRFIDQAFSGDKNLRSMEDLGEASMYEQAAALASGDPRALQLAGLKQDVERLERQQAAHANEQVSARTALQRAQWDVQTNQQKRAQYEKARKVIGDYFTFTSGKVGGTTYTKQGEFGQALKDAFNREAKAAETNPGPEVRQLATLGDGITLEMHAGTEWKTKKGADGKEESSRQRSGYHELTITAGGYTMTVAGSAMSLDADTDALGLARKAINALNGVESDLRRTNAALAELEIDQTRLRKKIGAPFEYQQEMLEKHAELQQLEEELRLEGLQKAAERVMLDEKGVGWKVVKGPYKSNGVLVADVERLDDTGETVKSTVAYATLKDVDAPPSDAGEGDTKMARTRRAGGVHMEDARAVVAAIREALPTAPPIHILESVSKAPKDLQRDIRAAGAENDVDAAYHNGEIYVFPANVPSIERLQFVLAHHEIRHHGLRAILGPRMNQVLFQIQATNPTVRAAAQRQVELGYAKSRVLATEEALADMAVEDIVKLNGWDKIVAAVRQWLRGAAMRLRRAGLAKVADALEPSAWTDKDIASLIARAEGVSRGGSARYAAEGTVFGQDGDMPAFYSALSREISASAARAQPAQGWISSIQGLVKAGKIKREELEWSGVLDWLQMQQAKITREQLVEYLDANGVKVEEKVLGATGQSVDGTLEAGETLDGTFAVFTDTGSIVGGTYPTMQEAESELQSMLAGDPTKYASYQLPGGTNYREVLLTLPDARDGSDKAESVAEGRYRGVNPRFQSGHWDQANILAHIRVNDRTDADGRKVLFVEEIQSDWAQGLRKNGTQTTTNRFSVRDVNGNIRGDFATADEADAYLQNPPENMRQFFEQRMGGEAARVVETSAPDIGIPTGPFVTKTDAWLSLALKRIVTMAAEGGYDRVAFVTGEQSAERYDLSKQIDEVSYSDDGVLRAFKKRPGSARMSDVVLTKNAAPDVLADIIGKEVAERLLKARSEDGYRRLSGVDLQIGGEGMRAFYDKIVPNTLKDVLRKVGGGALETVELPRKGEPGVMRKAGSPWPANMVRKQPGFTITPALREKVAGGLPLFARGPEAPAASRFARSTSQASAATLSRVAETIKTATKKTSNTFAHYRGLGLQALGRRQITELYGGILPQLPVYNQLMAQMDADKNEAGAGADQIAKDWGKLADERQLAEAMHDATLAQIDPEKPLVKGDDPLTYDRLRAQYDALSPEAKKVYVDARDTYRKHHENVRLAIRDRIERSELQGPRKAELLKQMDDEFYRAIKGVYFPLARFGDYVVIVRDGNGKAVSVNRAETINEAESLQASLRKAYPDMVVGKVLKSKEFNAGRDAVGRGFMQELYDVLGKKEMDETQRAELEDMLGQLYLSALPDLSWAKHGIHRKGTPGFSQDARRAFAQNTFHGARYLAKVRYSDLLENQLSDAQKQVDALAESPAFDSVKAQQVLDEMVKRHDSAMNPNANALSTALTSLGFVFHLGLSPASAMVNLTQTALVAFPQMGAKWGFSEASAALLKASQQAAANKNDISGVLSEDEKRAYDEAVRSGVIDVTMAHDLAGISQGEDAKVSWKLRPVMRWASFLFHHAEKFNRQVTFVAAYRLAVDAGTGAKDAYEQAVKATYDSHFDYSSTNRPRVMQGNTAKVLLLFKQYGQNMVYTLSRQAYLSMKGQNATERAQARKALGGLLAMHAAAAGVLGLPMVSTLLAAASMLGGNDDEPWDAEVALRNMLADALGKRAADVLSRGLSRLTPWDISGRVGLDKLILPDIQEGLEGQRLGESAMAAALGPVAGIAISLLRGLQEIADGNWARGLEAMAPSLARGPIKALRYGKEGAIDKTGKPILEEVNPFSVAGQALGFSPSDVRLATEAKSAVHQADARLAKRRATLMRHYSMAVIAGDQEGAADAREAIKAFNEKNPQRRIAPMQMAMSVAMRRKQIAQSEGGVYLPKSRRDAMEAGRFGMAN